MGDRGERVRTLTAPVVAMLGSALAMCCLVTVPDVLLGWPVLASLDTPVPAWAGLAVIVAVVIAMLSMLSSARIGSAPPLALGTVAAIFGMVLAHNVDTGAQLVLALLTLSTAVGVLVASGVCMVEELPPRSARLTLAGWAIPLAGGWGLLGWVAVREHMAGVARLGLHPPGWAVVVGAGCLIGWALLTLVLEPVRPSAPSGVGWENAWAALGVLLAGAGSIVMLVGFQPDLSASSLRPITLLTIAVSLVVLLGCGRLIPLRSARPAYLAVVSALLAGPSCAHLMMLVAREARGSVPLGLAAVFAAAGLLGWWIGWRAADRAMTAGLLIMALAAAGGWVLPSNPWLTALAVAPLVAGLAIATAAGLRVAARQPMSLRFVTIGGLTGLAFGLVAAAPLGWSLGAPLGGALPAARDGTRVLLGLSFALLVLVSAGVSLLTEQAREVEPAGETADAADLAGQLPCR